MKHLLASTLTGLALMGCAAHVPVVPTASCHETPVFESRAPDVSAAMERAAHWLEGENEKVDEVLLTPGQIRDLNARNKARDRAAYQDVLDPSLSNVDRVAQELQEREAWLRQKLGSKRYFEDTPGDFETAMMRVRTSEPVNALRIAAKEMDIRCVPMAAGLFTSPRDIAFDRNRCSRLHLGELVRVLRRSRDGAWLYVHAGHSVGWLRGAVLTPEVSDAQARQFQSGGARAVVVDDFEVGTLSFRQGRSFPLEAKMSDGSWRISVPTVDGLTFMDVSRSSPLHRGFMPFTRRHVFQLAFERLGDPYGWGGYRGGRDCSRFLLDLFAVFGVKLGRHSKVQGHSGWQTASVDNWTPIRKGREMSRWLEHGIVLAYMPGHIMLYLGERQGRPYALSAISEYLRPCADGHDVVRLDRVVVTDFKLGSGTERTDYLTRLTALTVFGALP